MVQMEKLVKQCDMEVMKTAMLKHEATFKQQVHELHRLYRIQKQLMSDLDRSPPELTCRRQRRKLPRRALNLQLPAEKYIVVGAAAAPPPPSTEDELELTLAVGGSASRRKLREATPDCSAGSHTSSSSSSDSDGDGASRPARYPYHQGGMVVKQPPWLVQCLSLRMA